MIPRIMSSIETEELRRVADNMGGGIEEDLSSDQTIQSECMDDQIELQQVTTDACDVQTLVQREGIQYNALNNDTRTWMTQEGEIV